MTTYSGYRNTKETNGTAEGGGSHEGGRLSTEEMSPSSAAETTLESVYSLFYFILNTVQLLFFLYYGWFFKS